MRQVGTRLALGVLASGLILAGCSGGDNTQLTEQIESLKAENSQLKLELAELKSGQTGGHSSVSQPGQGVSVSNRYTDLDDLPEPRLRDWINELNALGVFETTAGAFNPYEPITRAEYVAWLFKAYNKMHPDTVIRLAPQADPYFSDLSKEHPVYPYAQALAEAGYSVGYEDGTFRPEQPLTREEMLGIKVPVDNGGDVDNFMWGNFRGSFSDNDTLFKTRFVKYIQADLGYTNKPNGSNITRAFGNIKTFKRKEPVRRFEAAATIWQTDWRGKYTAASALAKMGSAAAQ